LAACYQVQLLNASGRPVNVSSGVQGYGLIPDSTPVNQCTGVVLLDPADYGVLQAGSIWSAFTVDQASTYVQYCVLVWGAAYMMRAVLRKFDDRRDDSYDSD